MDSRVEVASVDEEVREDDDIPLLGDDGRGLGQLELILVDVVKASLRAYIEQIGMDIKWGLVDAVKASLRAYIEQIGRDIKWGLVDAVKTSLSAYIKHIGRDIN